MTEAREGLPKTEQIQADKGGELDLGWKDNPYEAQRRRSVGTRESRRNQRRVPPRPLTRKDIDESWIGKPEPGPQLSQRPYPTERMNFGPEVQQRRKSR